MKDYKFYVIVREDTDEYFCFDGDRYDCKVGIRNAFFFEEKEEADFYLKDWNENSNDGCDNLWSVKEVSMTIKQS